MMTSSVLKAKADLREAKEKVISDTQARYKRQVKVRFAPGSLYTLKYFLDIIHEAGQFSTIEIEYEAVMKKNLTVWISGVWVSPKGYL